MGPYGVLLINSNLKSFSYGPVETQRKYSVGIDTTDGKAV